MLLWGSLFLTLISNWEVGKTASRFLLTEIFLNSMISSEILARSHL